MACGLGAGAGNVSTVSDPTPPLETPPAATRLATGGCVTCGAIIAVVFLMLGLTYHRASRIVLEDPAAIEANLQAIATCKIPSGYRALRGADDEGKRRIAVLAPQSFGGDTMEVDLPLVISAWSFPPDLPTEKRKAEVLTFWKGKTQSVLGDASAIVDGTESVQVRGAALTADTVTLTCKEATVRLLVVVAPRKSATDTDMAVFAFIGDASRFDTEGMRAFLASIE